MGSRPLERARFRHQTSVSKLNTYSATFENAYLNSSSMLAALEFRFHVSSTRRSWLAMKETLKCIGNSFLMKQNAQCRVELHVKQETDVVLLSTVQHTVNEEGYMGLQGHRLLLLNDSCAVQSFIPLEAMAFGLACTTLEG